MTWPPTSTTSPTAAWYRARTIWSSSTTVSCVVRPSGQSIIGILDRLGPKKIVIVSSSPQVRYPDYYGIDMSRMSEFIAFKAAIELLKEREMRNIIASAYRKSKEQADLPRSRW